MKEKSAGRRRSIFLCIVIAALVLVMTVFFVRAERNALAKKAGNSLWKVTEYATVTPNQCMFYTVEDSRGRLAVIDGGFEEDADQVLSVIRAHGNHVYDWIITHPHPDHVGALNAILTQQSEGKLSDVVIDHIYTTKVNKKRYEETAHDYDGIDAFEKFYNLTNGRRELRYLEENDEEDILGLKMKVLHAWDSHVDELEQNLCNDGSLMFVLSGSKNRILFCGDTQKEMEQYIIPAHKSELKADYVQCGHHGNWGLSTDFYDIVSPRAAFMDAPSSILDDSTGTYDAPQLKQYFQNHGVTVFSLSDAPNMVEIK